MRHWRSITDAVHQEGGHIFVQLMHSGRIFHELNLPQGARGVAPSAVAVAGDMWTDQAQMKPNGTPQALSSGEVRHVRDEYVKSATSAAALHPRARAPIPALSHGAGQTPE